MSVTFNPRNSQRSMKKPKTQLPVNFNLVPNKNPPRRSRSKPDLPFVREMKYRGVPYTINMLKKGFGS